jgi:histidyl-tRNA synthetase
MIIPFEQEQHTLGLLIALNLTKHGLCTDILLESSSIKSKMKKANKLGAAYVVLIGQDELANNYVTVKHMIKGTEEKVEQGKLLAYLRAHQ